MTTYAYQCFNKFGECTLSSGFHPTYRAAEKWAQREREVFTEIDYIVVYQDKWSWEND